MNDLEEIAALARNYFDALYFGNVDLFSEIFHHDARLFCNTNDDYVTMSVNEYLNLVRGRSAPAERNETRKDEILSIDMASPTTAHLRTREVFLPKLFTDELTLIKQNDKWLIVSKVWDFELLESI